jgi:hypothetical protein
MRIGSDTLSAILVASRQAAREEYREALAADFVSYDSNGGGSSLLMKEDVVRAVADAFPGMFSRDFAEQIFALGAATPPRVDRRLDDTADEGGDPSGPSGAAGASDPQAQAALLRRSASHGVRLSGEGWSLQQWITHMMDLSENVLL